MTEKNSHSSDNSGIVTIKSRLSFIQTIERLKSAFQSHSINVFAVIDQQAEAKTTGLDMPPMVLYVATQISLCMKTYNNHIHVLERYWCGAMPSCKLLFLRADIIAGSPSETNKTDCLYDKSKYVRQPGRAVKFNP